MNPGAGHSAVLHGCTVDDGSYIGASATVLDGAHVEKQAMVESGALVRQNTRIPSGEVPTHTHTLIIIPTLLFALVKSVVSVLLLTFFKNRFGEGIQLDF